MKIPEGYDFKVEDAARILNRAQEMVFTPESVAKLRTHPSSDYLRVAREIAEECIEKAIEEFTESQAEG